jgi:hypothetical protein
MGYKWVTVTVEFVFKWLLRLLLRQKTPVQIRLGLPAITTLVKVSHPSFFVQIHSISGTLCLQACRSLRHARHLREGDYHVIYEVHLDDKVVHVIAAGHRREIYR